MEDVKRVWFDTDIMIGLPERAPREVDDGITLMMALRQKNIEIVGISIITNADYGYDVTKKMLDWYNETGKDIPVYKGSDLANDLGVENDATRALADALRKEKLYILALGPNTNIATVLKNHPELASQVEEISFCIGRKPDYEMRPGLGYHPVFDYNFEKDVESIQVILDTNIPLLFSGFECSCSLLLGTVDIDRLNNNGHEGDQWVYDQLVPWIARAKNAFGVDGFIPYDCTPLGYFTHPEYFKYYENIPVEINIKKNDSDFFGNDLRKEKEYLEVSYDFEPKRTVRYAYQTLPGFEEKIIESILRRD
jgi:inosine-uridine nucleoside N-ribohydrolase